MDALDKFNKARKDRFHRLGADIKICWIDCIKSESRSIFTGPIGKLWSDYRLDILKFYLEYFEDKKKPLEGQSELGFVKDSIINLINKDKDRRIKMDKLKDHMVDFITQYSYAYCMSLGDSTERIAILKILIDGYEKS